jgi:hypothetical protein
MTEFSGAWDAPAVRTFLEERHLPIRIATRRTDGSLWPVAVWYRYRDGVFECATQARADLTKIVRNDPGVGFDVSTNDVPYRGIRGCGTATVVDDGAHAVLEELVKRYLGGLDSTLARRLLSDDRSEVLIRIEPTEIYSWDYSERMRDVEAR